MSPREAAVADAGPLIHLDELGHLDLLICYERVWVPAGVAAEAERHRAGWLGRGPTTIQIVTVETPRLQALRRRLTVALDPGEIEALAVWEQHREASLLCDDLVARDVARDLGAHVIGTLGLIVKAAKQKRLMLVDAASIIRSLPERTTLHVGRDLLEQAARQLEKELR